MDTFSRRVIDWQKLHGRHDLAWQGGRDAYRIWLSEVMLQQTQVATVIPYYQRFLAEFPDVVALARAPLERVLEAWSGLGYYRRARHLHAAARLVEQEHQGRFPCSVEELERLPGVGRSTAAAIAVFAAGARAAILDGNVKRVFSRHDAVPGHPGEPAVLARLWDLAQARLPEQDIEAYTQGLMDLGATLCTRARPRCDDCPLRASCRARELGAVTAYPAPRARRVVPVREFAVLLIVRDSRVLLQRRPAQGIWGGLWSLPECADASEAEVLRCLGELSPVTGWAGGPATLASLRRLPVIDHALTHFRLKIAPLLVHAGDPALAQPSLAADDYRWLTPADSAGAALPQPIKRLLTALATDR